MHDTRAWIERVTRGASARQIAAALGTPNSTVHRWFKDDSVPAEAVIRVARAYGASPVLGLTACGFLTEDETGIGQLSDLDLVAELHHRIKGETHVRPASARRRARNNRDLGGSAADVG